MQTDIASASTEDSQVANEPRASHEAAPRPTIAPAALAFGIMLVPWGILTHWAVSLVGFGIMCWAIGKWVDELRKD